MIPWLVGMQERGPVCLPEVRKETVGGKKDLGRIMIGWVEKPSWSLYGLTFLLLPSYLWPLGENLFPAEPHFALL